MRPLDLEHQLRLYRSVTKAITEVVAAREKWIAYVEEHGKCYCQNPFRAHVDHAEEWARFHLNCATHWPWQGDAPNPDKAAPVPPISVDQGDQR